MNAPQTATNVADAETLMQSVLEAQRSDYLAEGSVSAATRRDRLSRGIDACIKYQ
ncbi:MAG: coniferyl-aldehyde dehydrogenase, partial [Glaciecola sp.]